MSDIYQRIYQRKKMTAADAMSLVEDGDFISVPTGVGEPPTLLTALSEQRQRFHGVTVGQILPLRKYAYIDPETVDHVRHLAFFYATWPSSTVAPAGRAGRPAGSTFCRAISPKCRR